jgi:hypothetical protein
MLCLEVMHNVSMRLGRMDVLERAFCRLFLLFNLEKSAVVAACSLVVGFHAIEWNTLCSPLLVKMTQIAVITGSCPDTHCSPVVLDGRLRQ